MAKAGKKEIFGWCMFDFANSSFTTIVVTVVYAVYFTKIVCAGKSNADFLWSTGTFISQMIVLITAPVIGALADFSGTKKKFLFATYITCIAFSGLLFFVYQGEIFLGLSFFIIANIAFSIGENFNASFLTELADPRETGRISGYGWAWGYIGGLGCLVICYPFLTQGFVPENSFNLRFTNLITAGFFLISAIPTFLWLKEKKRAQQLPPGESYFSIGFKRVADTIAHLKNFGELFKFFIVFFFFSCGITTVISFAAIFAEREVGFSGSDLIAFFIIVQISSALGAFLFGFIQDRIGARTTINCTLAIWILVVVGAYFTHSIRMFYIIGNLAGISIGSSTSSSRALVALFSPEDRTAEFFGFWGLFWKLSSALGPLTFGIISSVTGSERFAILATGCFFVIGFIGMFFINEKKGREEVANYLNRQALLNR